MWEHTDKFYKNEKDFALLNYFKLPKEWSYSVIGAIFSGEPWENGAAFDSDLQTDRLLNSE